MSDEEDMERAKTAAHQLWARMGEYFDAVRRALRDFVGKCVRWFKAVWRFVCRWRQVIARHEWKYAQRNARLLSRHPDLSVFDGWLDRWYTDPALSC